MGARRRAGPAALAVALIGAGFALYRPHLVPDLRPGPRAGAPAASVDASFRPAAAAAEVPVFPASAREDQAAEAERAAFSDEPSLRDAPADAGFTFASGALAAPPASGLLDAARRQRGWLKALDAADADRVRARTAEGANVPLRSPADGRSTPAPRVFAARGFGSPLSAAPASAEEGAFEEADDDLDEGSAVDAHPAGRRSGYTRRPLRGFPLFNPPRRAVVRPRAPGLKRRARPVLLSKRLGRGALRPPPSSLAPPDLTYIDARKPARLPDGAVVPDRPLDLAALEARDPRRTASSCRKRGPHWDGALWHDGAARGEAENSRWLWLWKDGARWWARTGKEDPPFLRHHNLWWSKQRGVWFALHEGELWTWRRFAAWDAEGLIRLSDGVEIVYSADFTMAAVITPGAGAMLYDAATGVELGTWLESEMPRRRPRAPARLRLPPGI